jgi:hypothetical protein
LSRPETRRSCTRSDIGAVGHLTAYQRFGPVGKLDFWALGTSR